MPDYKRELILENMKTALQGITVANGFKTDVQLVDRDLEIYDDVPKDKIPAIFVVDGVEDYDGMPSDWYRNEFIVGLVAYVKKLDDVKLSTTLNNLIGDIKKKLHENTTRGGYALSTGFKQTRVFQGLPPPRGIFEMDVLVTYDGTFGEP